MKVNVIVNAEVSTVNAIGYNLFPKKGNAPEGYNLKLNGEIAETAMTGGGKYPKYVYFKHEGRIYHLQPGVVPDAGTDIIPISGEEVKPQVTKVTMPSTAGDIIPVTGEEVKPQAPKKQRKPKVVA